MKKRILSLLPLVLLLAAALCVPAFALTESEVEAQVAASGKAAVTGNVLIWFLCAVAFLKVSQKIDSFLSSLGINAGHTGGSMLAEAMVAARGVGMIAKAGGNFLGGLGGRGGGSSGAGSTSAADSGGGFFKGGLVGMAGRHITNSAVKTATTQTSAVRTAQQQSTTAATHTASGGSHTASAVQTGSAHTASSFQSGGVSTNSLGVIHTDSAIQSGGIHTDSSGIIQTENSVQSATIQSDSSMFSGQDNTASEAHSDSAVFADTMAQQEGVILTGHESQTATHSDSSSQVPSPGGGAASAPGGGTSVSHSDSTMQASHSTNSSHVVQSGGGGERVHTQSSATESAHTRSNTHTVRQTSIGGAVFARSLASGGKFANDVIGTVARGDIRSTGSITGDLASQSLLSYMGYTALGTGAKNIPRYSDVEIGGGRIMGTEYKAGSKEGLAFGMYHSAQYTAPEGPHEKVFSADGTMWFKQYAQDAVEKKPYKAPDGTVAYDEKIVKKLPGPPKRKDRI